MTDLEKLKAKRDAALYDCDRLFSAALADFRAVLNAKMFATRAEINAAFDAAIAARFFVTALTIALLFVALPLLENVA